MRKRRVARRGVTGTTFCPVEYVWYGLRFAKPNLFGKPAQTWTQRAAAAAVASSSSSSMKENNNDHNALLNSGDDVIVGGGGGDDQRGDEAPTAVPPALLVEDITHFFKTTKSRCYADKQARLKNGIA